MRGFFFGILGFLLCVMLTVPAFYYFKPKLLEAIVNNKPSETVLVVEAPQKDVPPPSLKEKAKHLVQETKLLKEEVSYAICGEETLDLTDPVFDKCKSCPPHMAGGKGPYEVKHFFDGDFSGKKARERLVFLKGCEPHEFVHGSVILLRRVFNSWEKVDVYINLDFEYLPIVFDTSPKIFLGIQKFDNEVNKIKKEKLIYVYFTNGLMQVKELFIAETYYGNEQCSSILQSKIDKPKEVYLKDAVAGVTINIEVLASNPIAKCTRNKVFDALSGVYELKFMLDSTGTSLVPDRKSQSILTNIESAYESGYINLMN